MPSLYLHFFFNQKSSEKNGQTMTMTIDPYTLWYNQVTFPTITKLLRRGILDDAKGEGCHHARQMFTDKKDIQCRRKIFVPNPIVFQGQLQEKHAISTPISYFKKYFTAELFEDYSKMTNVYALQNNIVFRCKNDNCKGKTRMYCIKLHKSKRLLRHFIQKIQKAPKIPSKGPFLDIFYGKL
jgi:hypothetical protein